MGILSIVGSVIFGVISIYLIIRFFTMQKKFIEGLTNQTNNTLSTNGEAGSSTAYASTVKAKTVQLQDELLISKYRKDYENIIINMDDYIGMLMLKQLVNINPNADLKINIEAISNLNSLKASKDTLNSIMKFLDTQ